MTDQMKKLLSGKYEFIRPLGEGNSSTVFLARHLLLNRDCAIKQVPQLVTSPDSVLSEAKLLQSIHHPGIPQVYDFEYDDSYDYIIEEYVPGESLSQYLLHQNYISTNQFFHMCEQICDIYHYLHTFSPHPFLYQDLKPEHIMIKGDQIKLIDFGSIWMMHSVGNSIPSGNTSFSAPEFLNGSTPSVQSDIYSIGKLVLYLTQYLEDGISSNFQIILNKATEEDPKLRYETVEAFWNSLKQELLSLQDKHLSTTSFRRFAVVGSFSGCGSTRLAIALTCLLNKLNASAIYLERNNSNAMNGLLSFLPASADKEGSIQTADFKGYPLFGPGISITYPKVDYEILDFGASFSHFTLDSVDRIFLVVSSAPWRWLECIHEAERLSSFQDKLTLVCLESNEDIKNDQALRKNLRRLASFLSSPIQVLSLSSDCFHLSKKDYKQLSRLLKMK